MPGAKSVPNAGLHLFEEELPASTVLKIISMNRAMLRMDLPRGSNQCPDEEPG